MSTPNFFNTPLGIGLTTSIYGSFYPRIPTTLEIERLLLSAGAWQRFFNSPSFAMYCRSDQCDIPIQKLIGQHDLVVRFLKKKARHWAWTIRTSYRTGTLIIKKKDKPDLHCPIHYRLDHDLYFSIAFSGRFKDEGGFMVFDCDEAGFPKRVVRLACGFINDPKENLEKMDEFFQECDTVEELEQKMRDVTSLGQQWQRPQLEELPFLYVDRYMRQTIQSGGSCLHRLKLFVTKNALLANYIWTHNFGSTREREELGRSLKISQKTLGGFKKAETPQQLLEYVRRKEKQNHQEGIDLPMNLWTKIASAQEKLKDAKRGGIWGRYTNSDSIEIANTRLRQLWNEADRWMTRKKLESAKKNVRLGVTA